MFVAIGRPNLPIGRDDLDFFEVIDGPSESPRQISEPAAERQPRDPDFGHDPKHRRQSMFLRRLIDILEQASGPGMDQACFGVDRHIAHERHIKGHATVGQCVSGNIVAAAFYAQEKSMIAGERDRRANIPGRGRLNHNGWNAMHICIPEQ